MEVALGSVSIRHNKSGRDICAEEEDEIDFTKPATSGMEYLRMVQREAARCPDVVVADELLVKFPTFEQTEALKSVLTPASMEFIPGFDWQCQQASKFAELRQQLCHFKSKDTTTTNHSSVLLPSTYDEYKWCCFCLGEERQAELRKLRIQPHSFHVVINRKQSKGVNNINEEKMQTKSERHHQGNEPLLSIVTKISQCALVQVLEYHISWLQMIGFSELQGKWIYALLVCLEKPLPPNVSSLLRTLARSCADLRALLTNVDDDQLAALNLIITLVTRYFDQTDLAEE